MTNISAIINEDIMYPIMDYLSYTDLNKLYGTKRTLRAIVRQYLQNRLNNERYGLIIDDNNLTYIQQFISFLTKANIGNDFRIVKYIENVRNLRNMVQFVDLCNQSQFQNLTTITFQSSEVTNIDYLTNIFMIVQRIQTVGTVYLICPLTHDFSRPRNIWIALVDHFVYNVRNLEIFYIQPTTPLQVVDLFPQLVDFFNAQNLRQNYVRFRQM